MKRAILSTGRVFHPNPISILSGGPGSAPVGRPLLRELGRTLTNVVMMGMGEPFHNYAATLRMVEILHDPVGMNLGARRITISTSGVVPRIDALAEEPYQVNLAVSLHAVNGSVRAEPSR